MKDKKVKVNLGSGEDYLDGWINVDINKNIKVDIVVDISKKLPFKDNSVDEVKASDILEHFTKEDGEKFLNECYRVLKKNGFIIIRTHNIYKIFEKFKNDPYVLTHFIYGDTSETGIFGSHKFSYTKDSLNSILKKIGFEVLFFENDQTNFVVKAKKKISHTKKLNIGIIMQSPDIGGAEIYMFSLMKELIKKDNNIIFASNQGKFLDMVNKIKIINYEIPFMLDIIGNYRGFVKSILLFPFAIVFYADLLWKFKKREVDVILMSSFTEKLLVTFLSIFYKIPVVWIEYGRLGTIFTKNFYMPKIIYRLVKGIPKYVIVPSRNTLNSLTIDARVSLSKLKLITLGIEGKTDLTSNTVLPFGKNKIIIGNVSRLTREKGQDMLIKTMPYILKEVPDARLILVGDGPDKNYYEKLIRDLKLDNKVLIAGFAKNIDSYYKKMDIFVFPTIWELEGFGLVLIEAMKNKLPILASGIGPVPEIIDDEVTGVILKSINEKSISREIISLTKDDKKRKKLGENAFIKFQEKYTIEKSSLLMISVLNDAANN